MIDRYTGALHADDVAFAIGPSLRHSEPRGGTAGITVAYS